MNFVLLLHGSSELGNTAKSALLGAFWHFLHGTDQGRDAQKKTKFKKKNVSLKFYGTLKKKKSLAPD